MTISKLTTIIAGLLLCSTVFGNSSANKNISIQNNYSIFPIHEPYGKGIGINPGRVVWSHNTKSVNWDGKGYWWNIDNFDEDIIINMVNNSIAKIAEKQNAKEGWNSIFVYFDQSKNKTGGYQKGEKIAIKVNINGSAVFDNDTSGKTDMSYTNPVLLKSLLLSLVEEANVNPSDITVYDVSRLFPDYMIEMCTSGNLKGVNFVGRNNATADKNASINWSYNFKGATNYLPTCVTEAKYIINMAKQSTEVS